MADPTADAYCRFGISLAGLHHFLQCHRHRINPEMTTSDVCHAVIKPLTSAAGWECEPVCTDPAPDRRWYEHIYRHPDHPTRRCGHGRDDVAPNGTTSLCQLYSEVQLSPIFS